MKQNSDWIKDKADALQQQGLIINNFSFFKSQILAKGYHDLVEQNLSFFTDIKTKRLIKGTTFGDLDDFYQLDQALKNQMMIALQSFEHTFKVTFAQILEEKESNYLKGDNLKISFQLKNGRLIHRGDLKARWRYLKKHYVLPNGFSLKTEQSIPLWLMVKELSFGIVTNWFFLLNSDKQGEITNAVFQKKMNLEQVEEVLNLFKCFRNRAAHNYSLLIYKYHDQYIYPQVINELAKLRMKRLQQIFLQQARKILKSYGEKHSKQNVNRFIFSDKTITDKIF